MKIGRYSGDNNLFLAPMAGVTDLPFRRLCREFGAGWVVGEMVWSKKHLLQTKKTQQRIQLTDEPAPRIIQIAGGEPELMAEAARYNVENGAQIIDINMGCPAKKVCNKAAGSALMKDEKLVAKILELTVAAVNVPVTLKIRTGWHQTHKNAVRIAKIAENYGIQSLAVHGRTREQKYTGYAEYDTIAEIKQNVSIPVIANGDIDSPEKAKFVRDYTAADGLMLGRAAQGKPWIFQQVDHFLQTGEHLPAPSLKEQHKIMTKHLQALHQFYGEFMGVRIARKHIGWYFDAQGVAREIKQRFNQLLAPAEQLKFIDNIRN